MPVTWEGGDWLLASLEKDVCDCLAEVSDPKKLRESEMIGEVVW